MIIVNSRPVEAAVVRDWNGETHLVIHAGAKAVTFNLRRLSVGIPAADKEALAELGNAGAETGRNELPEGAK